MKKKKLLLGLGLCSTMLVGTGCSKDEKAVANEEAPIVCTQEDLDELTANLVAKQKEYETVSARLTEVESLLATEIAKKEALEEEISQLQLQIQEMDVSYTVSINKEMPSEIYFDEWTELLSGISFLDKDNQEVGYSTGYGTSNALENEKYVKYLNVSLRVVSDSTITNVIQIEPVYNVRTKLKLVHDITYLGTPILRENSITFNMNDFSVPNPVIELSNGVSYTYSNSHITQVVGYNEIKNDSLMGDTYLWKTVEGDSLTLEGTFTPGEKYLFLFDVVANYWRSDAGSFQSYDSTETVGIIVTMPEAIVE